MKHSDFVRKPPSIALVAVASSYVHSALAPWCLKAGVEAYARTSCQIQVVEGTINEPVDRVADRIIAVNPGILGLSCYIWNITFIKELLPLLRQALPDTVIVLGGPEVSPLPREALMACPQADYVLCGEGEKPFALLVDALTTGEGILKVPGLCCRGENGFHLSPAYQHGDMPPSPYCDVYFAQLRGRIAYLETSRGCPFHCAFCLSGKGERVRCTSMERAKKEMLALAQSGASTVKLVDRTFNASVSRAYQLFDFVIRQQGKGIPEGVCFHFEIGGDLLDDATMERLATAPAGCIQLEIGIQSLNEESLRSVRRYTPIAALLQKLRRVIAPGNIHVHIDLIAGLPKEDMASFIQGFNRAFALYPHALQLGFLKVIPGSSMRLEPDTYPLSYSPLPPYQITDTPWLTAGDLARLQIAEQALEKLYNRGRFAYTMKEMTETWGISPFELFESLGIEITHAEKERGMPLPLDVLTQVVFDALCRLFPERKEEVRNLMLRDRLATTVTPLIPACLRLSHPKYHQAKEGLASRHPPQKGIYRAMSLAADGDRLLVLWADYDKPHSVTGRYRVNEMNLLDLLQ